MDKLSVRIGLDTQAEVRCGVIRVWVTPYWCFPGEDVAKARKLDPITVDFPNYFDQDALLRRVWADVVGEVKEDVEEHTGLFLDYDLIKEVYKFLEGLHGLAGVVSLLDLAYIVKEDQEGKFDLWHTIQGGGYGEGSQNTD